jgi:hypothetical protein
MATRKAWDDSEYINNSDMSNNDRPPIPYSVFLNEYRTSRKRPRRWDNPSMPSMSRRDAMMSAADSIDGESANRQGDYITLPGLLGRSLHLVLTSYTQLFYLF